jgi:hypothetical protein
MDFTPVTFSDAKYPHQTTNAHELALSVIFETPIQHFADGIDAYHAQPQAVKTFLKQVPTAWDETRVLSGEPGQTLVIARRAGDTWYVGGINGTEAAVDFRLDTAFLREGKWRGTTVVDGPSGRGFVAGGVVDLAAGSGLPAASRYAVRMQPHGGFVMRLTR